MATRSRRSDRQRKDNLHTRTSVEDEAFCPIIAVFQTGAINLADRHDKRERLIRQSRDVAIESKRIIFLLHSALTSTSTKEVILAEAKDRIQKLINNSIKAIALELADNSCYLYQKAITAGLQEFVEARSLLSYMENQLILPFDAVRNELTFTIMSEDGRQQMLPTHFFQPEDYMLGLADLSGEVMRKAINGMASGDIAGCAVARDILQHLYTGFLGMSGGSKQMQHKLDTTRNNLLKVELAMFTFRVRRNEALQNLMQQLQLPPLVEPAQPEAAQHDAAPASKEAEE